MKYRVVIIIIILLLCFRWGYGQERIYNTAKSYSAVMIEGWEDFFSHANLHFILPNNDSLSYNGNISFDEYPADGKSLTELWKEYLVDRFPAVFEDYELIETWKSIINGRDARWIEFKNSYFNNTYRNIVCLLVEYDRLYYIFAMADEDQFEVIEEDFVEIIHSFEVYEYKEVDKAYVDTVRSSDCFCEGIEIVGLYPILDSIASYEYELLFLLEILKAKGFEFTDWGAGNWMEGPRMVSFTLENGDCTCAVAKFYYSTEVEEGYRVTERIKCRKVIK